MALHAFGEPLRRTLFDLWQTHSPRDLTGTQVDIVEIDLDSLERHGKWPWPRAYMADLVHKIAQHKPKVIALDMLFDGADSHNPEQWAALYPELASDFAPSEMARLSSLPTMDDILAMEIQAAPTILGRAGVEVGGTNPDQLFDFSGIEHSQGERDVPWLRFPQVLASIHALDDVALSHGLMNGPPDSEGRIRRVPTIIEAGGRLMPSLSLETARLSLGDAAIKGQRGQVTLGDITLFTDERGQMPLRLGYFPAKNTYSAINVMDQTIKSDIFRDRIVMIGLTAEGNADVVSTPLANVGFGIFVQAQAVDAILRGGWLRRPVWASAAEWCSAALIALLLAMGGIRKRPLLLALAGALAVVCPIAAWAAFDRANLVLDPFRPLLLAIGAASGLGISAYVQTRGERSRLAETLVKERVAAAQNEGELNAARSIQMGMLPDSSLLANADDRLDIAATLQSARSVGGDFYDFVRLDRDHIAFVVGDVTGKGVPAALYMALSKALTKSIMSKAGWSDKRAGLSAAIGQLNAELMRDHDESMGVTMVAAVLDCRTGHLAMTSAGHDNPLRVSAGGHVSALKLEGGPPLCVVDFDYPVDTATLSSGDCLVLITDGVSEARSVTGDLYGNARVVEALSGLGGQPAAKLLEALVTSVRRFEGKSEPSDDLTVLVVRFSGDSRQA